MLPVRPTIDQSGFWYVEEDIETLTQHICYKSFFGNDRRRLYTVQEKSIKAIELCNDTLQEQDADYLCKEKDDDSPNGIFMDKRWNWEQHSISLNVFYSDATLTTLWRFGLVGPVQEVSSRNLTQSFNFGGSKWIGDVLDDIGDW